MHHCPLLPSLRFIGPVGSQRARSAHRSTRDVGDAIRPNARGSRRRSRKEWG